MAGPRKRWMTVLLVLLPTWLVVSAAVGIWWQIRKADQREVDEQARYPRTVNAKELMEDVRKIAFVVGERGTGSVEARRGLDRVAALIEGGLGPSNTGYRIRRSPGPRVVDGGWSLIEVSRVGRNTKAAAVWVVCGYDAEPGQRGIERNASGVAAVMAAARELVDADLERSLHFLFVPHAFEPESPVLETVALALRRIESAGGARQVLCVEEMGRSAQLGVATRDTESPVVEEIAGVGKVLGAEAQCLQDDVDLASVLFESGLPAARVTSATAGVEGAPESLPDPKLLAGSTGRLVELLRRLAGPGSGR